MSDDHMNGSAETTLDPLDAELRSLATEMRMDEILAGIGCGDTTISAGGISLSFASAEDDEVPEPDAL